MPLVRLPGPVRGGIPEGPFRFGAGLSTGQANVAECGIIQCFQLLALMPDGVKPGQPGQERNTRGSGGECGARGRGAGCVDHGHIEVLFKCTIRVSVMLLLLGSIFLMYMPKCG